MQAVGCKIFEGEVALPALIARLLRCKREDRLHEPVLISFREHIVRTSLLSSGTVLKKDRGSATPRLGASV